MIIRLKDYKDTCTVRRMLSFELKIGVKSTSEGCKTAGFKALGYGPNGELEQIVESDNDECVSSDH